MNIEEFKSKIPYSEKVDFLKVENVLGFKLNDEVKSFYSRAIVKKVEGFFNLRESIHIKLTGNDEFDHWFSFNNCEGKSEFELYPLDNLNNAEDFIRSAFDEWTGGNNFGKRIMIGQLYLNIGQILILINNETGQVEWVDCGYGYYDVYDENPNGVLAYTVQAFLDNL